MIYLNVQMKYKPKRQGEIVKATRIDNGEQVIGQCFYWEGNHFRAVVCEAHHERVSHGHKIDPYSIEQVV
jgi:hypothetical protein